MDEIRERFLSKVNKTDSCWLWTAARRDGRYGVFSMKTVGIKDIYAHRAAWMLFVGDIPQDMHVLHKCDVMHCVNPDHLWVGTNADNARDRKQKGRNYTGPKPWLGQYQKERTHCPQGHEYNEANTYVNRGKRSCRTCTNAASAAYKRARRTDRRSQAG